MNVSDTASGIVGIIILIGFVVLLLAQNKNLFKSFLMASRFKRLDEHFIFNEIQLWLDSQIDSRCNNVSDKKRSDIAKKFLRIRFEEKREYYKNLIQRLKKNKTITMHDISDLKIIMTDKIYEKAERENIPIIVVDKFLQYRSYSEKSSHYLYERILQFNNFNSNVEKLAAIYCVDLMEIYNSSADIENVIMSLNGEIDKALAVKG